MSIALPDGFVDVGPPKSITVAGSSRVRMGWTAGAFGSGPSHNPLPPTHLAFVGYLDGWEVLGIQYTDIDGFNCPETSPYIAQHQCWIRHSFHVPNGLMITSQVVRCVASIFDYEAPWSEEITMMATYGPYRLGRRRILSPDIAETPQPRFDQVHMVEQYRWFADAGTRHTTQCGPSDSFISYLQEGVGGGTLRPPRSRRSMRELRLELSYSVLMSSAGRKHK